MGLAGTGAIKVNGFILKESLSFTNYYSNIVNPKYTAAAAASLFISSNTICSDYTYSTVMFKGPGLNEGE